MSDIDNRKIPDEVILLNGFWLEKLFFVLANLTISINYKQFQPVGKLESIQYNFSLITFPKGATGFQMASQSS